MKAEEYLQSHSINQGFADKMGWSFDDDRKIITIPIFNEEGQHLFNRYRHLDYGEPGGSKDKFSADIGSHPALCCLHKIKDIKDEPVVLCEGEPDCVRLWQEGIPAVTGTCGVKTFSRQLAAPLKNKKVLIVLDTDEEGFSSVKKYYEILEEVIADPYIKDLPQGFKDVCEYFSEGHTREEFENLPELTLEDWLIKHEPEEYTWRTADDFLKLELPPERWLVDHIIPIEGISFIVGPEASGKSFFALTLAYSVASGTPWLDKFEVNKQTKVLIIDKENTQRRTQDRLRGLGITGKNIYWLTYPQNFAIADDSTKNGYSSIAEFISKKVAKYDVGYIIFDSFTDVLEGNENDRQDIQKFVDAVRQLFPKKSVMILHHPSKPTAGIPRSSSQKARGSTNIMAQAYTAFYTEAVNKSKTDFTIEQTKAGDAEKLTKFLTRFQIEPDPLISNGTLVTNIEYIGEVAEKATKLEEAVNVIKEIFEKSGRDRLSRSELLAMCQEEGVTSSTFSKAINQLKADGKIKDDWNEDNRREKDYIWQRIYGEDD